LKAETRSFSVQGKPFSTPPHLMGVINMSPDSWYRESVCMTTEQAVQRAALLSVQGADLIDLGAESTLLDAELVASDAQLNRLLPLIETLQDSSPLLSVETYHPSVAAECLEAGASVLNLTGPESNSEMYSLAAKHGAGVIICYVQAASVREAKEIDLVEDHVAALMDFFAREIDNATQSGVEAIWVDPGLGFYYKNLQDSSRRVNYQLRTFLETFRLRELGWPVCHALPHAFEQFGEEVRSAEAFFAVPALLGRTELLRTHEVAKVKAVVETLRLFDSN
jgi:dihydropteroate synthase